MYGIETKMGDKNDIKILVLSQWRMELPSQNAEGCSGVGLKIKIINLFLKCKDSLFYYIYKWKLWMDSIYIYIYI